MRDGEKKGRERTRGKEKREGRERWYKRKRNKCIGEEVQEREGVGGDRGVEKRNRKEKSKAREGERERKGGGGGNKRQRSGGCEKLKGK